MPKRTKDEYDSDDGFVEDAPAKSSKKTHSSSSGAVGTQQTSADGDAYWALNERGMRRATVSEFKGRTMLNIREFYEKDGQVLPGKKGISLTIEQVNALLNALPGIEAALAAKGESVVRPDYGAAPELPGKDEDMKEDPDAEEKKNFEATSDEDNA